MTILMGSIPTKNHLLSVCVRLFLEQGYKQTTVRQIASEAGVSVSSFQNFFGSKDGVLGELIAFMFGGQFGAARDIVGAELPPVYTYAAETAIQLVLTELNENLRDIYLEVYSLPNTSEYIFQHTARELRRIFGAYLPDYSESDFYEFEIGSAGIMRKYMARKCDIHFSLEKKVERFLTVSLRAYRVPEEEQAEVLAYIGKINLRALADEVMQKLFAALEMKFDFTLAKTDEKKEP